MTRTPDVDRVRKSRDRLREAGGVVTSIRLSPEAARAAAALIASGYAADRRGVIERALLTTVADLVTSAQIEAAAIEIYAAQPDRMRADWAGEDPLVKDLLRMQVRIAARSFGQRVEGDRK